MLLLVGGGVERQTLLRVRVNEKEEKLSPEKNNYKCLNFVNDDIFFFLLTYNFFFFCRWPKSEIFSTFHFFQDDVKRYQ